MRQLPPINQFSGQYHFLSNFYREPFQYKGIEWPTAEHAYQAEKCIHCSEVEHILKLRTPGEAKRFGRSVALRPDWEAVKVEVMENILRAKFSSNPLAIRLKLTGDAELIEGNKWGDTYWGQCPLGNGENMLGKLLMKIRAEMSVG